MYFSTAGPLAIIFMVFDVYFRYVYSERSPTQTVPVCLDNYSTYYFLCGRVR